MITVLRPESIPETRLQEFKAYEFKDLSALKQRILEWLENADIITRRNNSGLINDLMTVDIETTTISAGTEYNSGDQAYALPYLYQVYIAGCTAFFRYDGEFSEFYKWLDNTLHSKNLTLPVYVHNLSFEYHFFKSRFPIDFESVFALQSRRIGKFESALHGLVFRCSYLLSNMSLEKFTENYCTDEFRKDKDLIDYEILRFPWSALDNEILYYSGMDVIALYHAVKNIIEKESDNLKTVPMTNTGYVRRVCRDACLGKNTKHWRTENEKKTYLIFKRYRQMFLKCAPTLEQYDMLRKAFRGGNTHANRFKIGAVLDNVGSFDFASSYPAALICYDGFPMGRLMDCTASLKTPDDITRYASRYWLCITAVFKDLCLRDSYNTLCPYISLSKGIREWDLDENGKRRPRQGYFDNGRILRQDGFFEMTFLGCEWDVIRKQYKGEIKVKKAFYTVKGELPFALRKTCFDWYKAKTELKNVAGSEYEYMKSKNRVNSTYGMMVEQIIKKVLTVDNNGSIEEREPNAEEAKQQMDEFLSPRNRKFLLYQWGVTITAICRVRHMEIIDLFGRDFVYGDTDSVKTEHPEKYFDAVADYNKRWVSYASERGIAISAFTRDGEEQILGWLDYEKGHYSKQFSTLGAKKYCDVDQDGKLHITVAGVPKKIGADILGDIENFKPGFTFETKDTDDLNIRQNWKKLLTYRDDLNEAVTIEGHTIEIKSCIALERTMYKLDISDELADLSGYHDRYETIYEEDPEIWE